MTMWRTRSIHFLLPAAAPAMMSEWPARYLVALWTTMSKPSSMGFCRMGVAKVLSMIETILWFLAKAMAFSRLTRRSVGLVGVSMYRTLLRGVTSLKNAIAFAKNHNLVSIIDNTFATPILQKPIE